MASWPARPIRARTRRRARRRRRSRPRRACPSVGSASVVRIRIGGGLAGAVVAEQAETVPGGTSRSRSRSAQRSPKRLPRPRRRLRRCAGCHFVLMYGCFVHRTANVAVRCTRCQGPRRRERIWLAWIWRAPRGRATRLGAAREPTRARAAATRARISPRCAADRRRRGFQAVSMRRVAVELGAGTMTLYHYVRTKDELFALMDDAIMGELLIPDDELRRTGATRCRDRAPHAATRFMRHPWPSSCDEGDASTGPQRMRHFEQSLAAVAGTGLDVDQFEIVSAGRRVRLRLRPAQPGAVGGPERTRPPRPSGATAPPSASSTPRSPPASTRT